MSEHQTTTTTATNTKSTEPDTSEPTPERQAELRAAYDANVAAGKPPYEGVVVDTLGELKWIIRERAWSIGFGPPAEQHANLRGANLGGANLSGIILQRADLSGVNFAGATLRQATLARSNLTGANLYLADLTGANLYLANLTGAVLYGATLIGADLRDATLDAATDLSEATISAPGFWPWSVGDVRWGGVNLTRINWDGVTLLGDESNIRWHKRVDGHRKVVRAYRQIAAVLRDQGLHEEADRFAFRAKVRQRAVLLRQRWLGAWLFSWLLFLLAGYGFRPARTLFWYLATIAAFAFLYMQATTGWIPFGLPAPSSFAPLTWYEALILSVSSFHGRGFFQPLQSLGDPVAALAAIEAVIGLFIEISFIATFTQRYFGTR